MLFCTDPGLYQGGEFQYFLGTIEEAVSLLKTKQSLPPNRVYGVGVQQAGFGIFQQGCMVMHRARAATGQARTTLVLSYTPVDPTAWDGTVMLYLLLPLLSFSVHFPDSRTLWQG